MPSRQSQRGTDALPLPWRDPVVGWDNAGFTDDRMAVHTGIATCHVPHDAGSRAPLDDEIERLGLYLGAAG